MFNEVSSSLRRRITAGVSLKTKRLRITPAQGGKPLVLKPEAVAREILSRSVPTRFPHQA